MNKKLLILFLFLPFASFSQTKIIVNYVKTDSIKARSTHIDVIDTLNAKEEITIRDTSLYDFVKFHAGSETINFGTNNQIPFMNSAGSDFEYSSNFKWDGTTFTIDNGDQNVFVGNSVGGNIDTGIDNVSVGWNSGYNLIDGNGNTFFGTTAGYSNEGNDNVFIGRDAGYNNISGSQNVFIGRSSGSNETGSNKLYIENSNSSSPLIYGDFANDELWFNTDTTHIVGHLEIDSNLYVYGRSILEKYEVAARVPVDSTLQTSVTSTWKFLGDGDNNKFVNKYVSGFTFDGDTLVFQQNNKDLRDSIEFHLDWSTTSFATNNGVTIYYGIFVKHVGESIYTESDGHTLENKMQTSGDLYSWANSTYPLFLKDGDKIQIRIKSALTSTTVTTKRFKIYLREQ